jgi:hypothetical protein
MLLLSLPIGTDHGAHPEAHDSLTYARLAVMRLSLLLRMQFIEFLLHQYGTVNRSAIVDFFGLSQPQASIDLQGYLDLAPGNAVYVLKDKTYRRSAAFVRLWP